MVADSITSLNCDDAGDCIEYWHGLAASFDRLLVPLALFLSSRRNRTGDVPLSLYAALGDAASGW